MPPNPTPDSIDTLPTPALSGPAVAASNAFGVELFRVIGAAAPDTNVFVSPYSVSVALTMAAEGARSETESEMSRVLAFPQASNPNGRAIAEVHAGHAALLNRLAKASGTEPADSRARTETLRAELERLNTQSEKLRAVGNREEAFEVSQAAQSLASELEAHLSRINRFELSIANALWVEQGFALKPEYTRTLTRHYGEEGVHLISFARDPEAARLKINAWVEEHTSQRIKDLFPLGTVDATTRLAISNAVYFKGEWASPFHASSTRDSEFTLESGARTRVRMMQDRWRKSVPYAAFSSDGRFFETPQSVPANASDRPATYPDDDGFTVIELPYKGEELSMVVFAPRKPSGMPALERRVSAENLEAWLKRVERRTVDTSLPCFKMGFATSMKQPLQTLGIKRAFTPPGLPDGAQFSGMCEGATPVEQLYIGTVLHKAWLEVSEKGTEAAGATAVAIPVGAPPPRQTQVPFVPVFRADRPFLFFIRDMKTGLVLFAGRMMNPSV